MIPRRHKAIFVAGKKQSKKTLRYKILSVFIIFALVLQTTNPGLSAYIAQLVTEHQRTPQSLASQAELPNAPAVDAVLNQNQSRNINKPSEDIAKQLANDKENQSKGKAQDHRRVKALDENRTEHSRVFLNTDGSKSLEHSAQATSYKDKGGTWRDVDASLEKDSSGTWSTKANSWKASFGDIHKDGVQLSVDGKTFKLTPVGGSEIQPKVAGTAPEQIVTYENVWKNTDIQYKISGSQIKETIILKDKDVASEYEFTASGANLVPKLGEAGAFKLDGAFKGFEIAAPTVATHDKGIVTKDSPITQSAKGNNLALTLSKKWLESQSEKSFPIVIDPTVFNVGVGINYRNFVSNGTICDPGQGCGNSLGFDLIDSWRFAYRVSVPSSPGQYLVSAKLHVEMPPPDGTFYYGVTGPRSIKITKAGCTNSFNCISTAYGEVAATVGTSADIEVGSLYRAAVSDNNPSPWMMVRGDEGSTESYKYFDDTKTKVTFTYETLPTQSTIATSAPVNEGISVNTQPTLTSTVPTDPDGPGPFKYRYIIGGSKNVPVDNPFNIKPSVTGVIADSGLESLPQWVVPDNVLQDGKTYYWQAVVWDSYQGAPQVYGPVYSFKVDLRNGKDATQAYDTLGKVDVDFATGNLTTSNGTHTLEALGGEIGLSLDYNSPQRSRSGLVGQYWNDPGATRTFPSSAPIFTRVDPKVSFNWGSASPYPGAITTDNFLVRWSGYFVAPQNGTYQFGTTSDDRSRIYINGNLHANGWNANPANLFGTGIPLTSGQVIPITYEFAEWAGSASAQLLVKTSDNAISQQVIPGSWLQTGIRSIATPHGLQGRYYTDTGAHTFPADANDSSRIFLTRADTSLNQNWGANSPLPNGPKDNFMVRWTGFFTAPATDTYKFGAGSDDGVRVIINGNNTVVNAWSNHGAEPVIYASSGVSLTAGQTIPITVEYYEATGDAQIGLYVKRASLPSAPDTVVESSWLSPQEQVLPAGWNLGIDAGGSLSYDYAVVNQGSVTLYDSSGETHEYKYTNGGFKPPANESGSMVRNGDGTVTLQNSDGRTYIFNTDGTVKSVTTPTDDRSPAALTYTYSGSPTRLTQITDGATSNRWMKLFYSGSPECPSVPSGFLGTAPAGMICAAKSHNNDVTKFFYTGDSSGVPRLARAEQPGSEITDYGYDGAGRIIELRDSLANDAITAGVHAQNTNEKTNISYDALGRVAKVELPAATLGETRIAHTYKYLFNSTTLMNVANTTEPHGFNRKVTYDGTYRTLTDTDVANLTNTTQWHAAKDLLLSETDPANLTSTSLYDYADRATDEYGPAPAAWYGSDRKPIASPTNYAAQVPRTQTAYDEGINGLAAAYYNVSAASNGTGSNTKVLFGNPKDHATGVGPANGDILKTWNGVAPIIPDSGYGWGASLTGDIHLTTAGQHTFRILSDDGARLWIDDNLVIDDWVDGSPRSHPTGTYNNTSSPADSWHRIRIDYYNKAVGSTAGTDARLELHMKAPGGTETSSLGSILKPRYGLVTTKKEYDSHASVGDRVTVNNYGSNPELGLVQSSREDPAGLNLTTNFTYETKGATSSYLRQTSKTLPGGNATNYAYYSGSETRQNPCNTSQTFKQAGMMKKSTEPDPDGSGSQTGRAIEVVYDDAGRVAAERYNAESWKCITYDARGRLLRIAIPAQPNTPNVTRSARTVYYNWSETGNPLFTSISDGSGKVTTGTDLLGRIFQNNETVITDPDPLSSQQFVYGTSYTYDNIGRLASKSSDALETFEYDNFNRLTAHKLDGATIATPSYDAYGRLRNVAYPNAEALASAVSRDSIGRINNYNYTLGDGIGHIADAVTRSQSGQVVSGTENSAAKSYSYDKAGRLTNAVLGSNSFAYSYAAPSSSDCPQSSANLQSHKNSNRTSQTVNGATTRYCYDKADRLLSSTDADFTTVAYDSHGNISSGNSYTKLEYDSSDRSVYVNDRSGAVTSTRDALDRPLYLSDRGCFCYYGYSDTEDTPTSMRDSLGQQKERYIQLPGGVLATVKASSKTYSLPNLHGDTFATADEYGQLDVASSYDPYGKPLGSSADVPDNSVGSNEFAYLGQHGKATATRTNSKFMQMGARLYLPTLGRFAQIDPIEGGNQNSYVYPGDPVNKMDLDGEVWGWVVQAAAFLYTKAGTLFTVTKSAPKAKDLGQQLAIKEGLRHGGSKVSLKGGVKDPQYRGGDWDKYRFVLRGESGRKIVVHWMRNNKTHKNEQIKIKFDTKYPKY